MKRKFLSILLVLSMFIIPISVSADSNIEYVAIGDSISTGYGLSTSEKNFVTLVAEEHGFDTATEVLNAAGDGYTIADVLASLETTNVKEAIRTAEVVTLTVGGNDLLEVFYQEVLTEVLKVNSDATIDMVKNGLVSGDQTILLCAASALNGFGDSQELADAITAYEGALNSVIDKIYALNANITIIIVTQYNPYEVFANNATYKSLYNGFEAAITDLNDVISDISYRGVEIADVYGAFKNNASLLNASLSPLNIDIHPNAAGHAVIAETIDEDWVRRVPVYLKNYPDSSDLYEATIIEDVRYIAFGESFELPERDGYIFLGYYTTPNYEDGIRITDNDGRFIPNATGYTDANGYWIAGRGVTLYAGFEKMPDFVICDSNGTNCLEVDDSNEDVLGDGTMAYDADKKTITIKDAELKKIITIYRNEVEIILDNAKLYNDDEIVATRVYGYGKNLTITLKSDSAIEVLNYEYVGGKVLIQGEGVLTVDVIDAQENDLLEITENVTVNAQVIWSYGLFKISGTVNVKTVDDSMTAIDTDKILITKTGKVNVEGAHIGINAYGDYYEFLDNSNTIVIEKGGSYTTKNTKIAMVVNTYFEDEALAGNKVIVLPEGYLADNQDILMAIDEEYPGYYYYTIGKKGSQLEISRDEDYDLVLAGSLDNVVLEDELEESDPKDDLTPGNDEEPGDEDDPVVEPTPGDEDEQNKENPDTADRVLMWIATFGISLGGLHSIIRYRKRYNA